MTKKTMEKIIKVAAALGMERRRAAEAVIARYNALKKFDCDSLYFYKIANKRLEMEYIRDKAYKRAARAIESVEKLAVFETLCEQLLEKLFVDDSEKSVSEILAVCEGRKLIGNLFRRFGGRTPFLRQLREIYAIIR